MDAFASLEASGEVQAKTVREILVGCGPCGKSIRLKERHLGGQTPCPACGTLLAVDAFDLPKSKKRGATLIDLSHLELEAADPLLGGRGFAGDSTGSTMGGSSIQMATGAGASGYALEDSGAGLVSSPADNSQRQMSELRELNDLKHSGQISQEEYRNRKKEIYAGRTLAIQALSRSTDGSGPSGRLMGGSRRQAILPGPVKALMAAAVIGVGGYLLWSQVLAPMSSGDVAGRSAVEANMSATANRLEATSIDGESKEEESLDKEVAGDALVADGVSAADEASLVDEALALEAGGDVALEGAELGALGDVEPVVEEVVVEDVYVVSSWEVRNTTKAYSDPTLPIGQACDFVLDLDTRNGNAKIGVAVGPEMESMKNDAFVAFRDAQYQIFLDQAEADEMLKELEVKKSDRLVKVGRRRVHRMSATHKINPSVQANVLTLVHDGRAVAYWFAGNKMAYPSFVKAVGSAVILTETEADALVEKERARALRRR
ncbi:MAG: SHOCT domain-containing protein [Algisphaera sp.]